MSAEKGWPVRSVRNRIGGMYESPLFLQPGWHAGFFFSVQQSAVYEGGCYFRGQNLPVAVDFPRFRSVLLYLSF